MAEEPTLVRKKRKRSKYPLHWVVIPLLSVSVFVWGWRRFAPFDTSSGLPGYITSLETFSEENTRYYGSAVNSDAQEKFQLAAESMQRRDYGGAAALLEEAAKQTALPVIFNDLGVLYAHMDDTARAVNAFREVLTRDSGYRPTRQNLERFKVLRSLNAAIPVNRELEPNDAKQSANILALGQSIEGTVENASDVDWYRVSSPAPPRDMVEILFTNKTSSPGLKLNMYDDSMTLLGSIDKEDPGATVRLHVSPPPNTDLYIKIEGIGATGLYSLLVRPMKAFDAYEPNDQIYNPANITVGQTIEANIMDAKDTDYYSFASPRSGTLTIEIKNGSDTLIPAITKYAPDMRQIGFGPDVTKLGASLRDTISVEENKTYYLRVWSHNDTVGAYELTIK
ncbi:MAG TPA: hypothetical protein VKU19_15215 [Bryobacteraceae bacterium]|nr:hypothetical protein [Bryobacteraceae bacterium]